MQNLKNKLYLEMTIPFSAIDLLVSNCNNSGVMEEVSENPQKSFFASSIHTSHFGMDGCTYPFVP